MGRALEREKERYIRQLGMEEWNQDKLRSASVLVAGVGGLGSASSLYLAAAGVGFIRLCDPDRVELSDLNRQILYSKRSLGRLKVEEARNRLAGLNPEIKIEALSEKISERNIEQLAAGCDLIVDGLDNMETRLVLNSYSVRKKIPYIYGAVHGWVGLATLILPPKTGCLACLMPSLPAAAGPVPVAGLIPGTIGLIQAAEACKHLMGIKGTLAGRLLVYDSRALAFDVIDWERNPSCLICGERSKAPRNLR
jgi:molybdopterin/thiamine biosynthesis adenylyltransferase